VTKDAEAFSLSDGKKSVKDLLSSSAVIKDEKGKDKGERFDTVHSGVASSSSSSSASSSLSNSEQEEAAALCRMAISEATGESSLLDRNIEDDQANMMNNDDQYVQRIKAKSEAEQPLKEDGKDRSSDSALPDNDFIINDESTSNSSSVIFAAAEILASN
jgi:hypothetical protein